MERFQQLHYLLCYVNGKEKSKLGLVLPVSKTFEREKKVSLLL